MFTLVLMLVDMQTLNGQNGEKLMLSLFLANRKLISYAAAILALLYAGWHSRTIYDGYIADKQKTKVIEKLGEGQNDIIRFNSAADKAIRASKYDKCINSTIPKEVLNLLK